MLTMAKHCWNVTLFYVTAMMLTTFYPLSIGTSHMSRDHNYIPKSKQSQTNGHRHYGTKFIGWWRSSKDMIGRIIGYVYKQLRLVARSTKRNNLTGWMSQHVIYCMAIIAMQASEPNQKGARITKFDTDSASIGVDNRCSGCISHRVEDFEGPLINTNRSIRGFGGIRTHKVKMGTLRWKWLDDSGAIHSFRIPKSYYIPSGNVRLMSPQHWAKAIDGHSQTRSVSAGETTTRDKTILFWGNNKYRLTIPMCPKTNVATFQTAPGYNGYQVFCHQAEVVNDQGNPLIIQPGVDEDDESDVEDNEQLDLTKIWPSLNHKNISEKRLSGNGGDSIVTNGHELDRKRNGTVTEFLNLHNKAGHTSFAKLKVMAKQGIIPSKFASCPTPVCPACMYGKATKRRWRDKQTKESKQKEGRTLRPGDKVSVDQIVSPTPGFVAQMTGILTTKRYKYATVYVDQSSGLGFTYLQKTASAEETLQSKRSFEAFSQNRGVTIRSYHADNGIFRANAWMDDCRQMRQPMTFAGVAAHHQNGYAERRIRSLQEMARTMLVHANHKWSQAVTTQLWPYALRMANQMINEAPNMQDPQRRSPEQIFTTSQVQVNPKHWHTFGCPVYVLDNELQTGKPYHKWKERAHVGIYLGRSPHHARNVALVLDRNTGLVSPQFHVAFDSAFDSVRSMDLSSSWQLRAGFVTRNHRIEQMGDKKARVGDPESHRVTRAQRESKRMKIGNEELKEKARLSNRERDLRLQRRNVEKEATNTRPEGVVPHQTPQRMSPDLINSEEEKQITSMEGVVSDEIFCFESMIPHGQREVEAMEDPMAYKAVADPDTMYWHQAMKEPDKAKFQDAMEKEVTDQYNNGNFTVVSRDQVPSGHKIFPAVWQMRRKRDIRSQKIKKYKARLNLDGSRMKHGVDYEETYAPVTTWRSIRMLLTMVAMYKWRTLQLDYVLAFPQAPVERELYMAIPKGFDLAKGRPEDYALQIHKNIYGQKQAGRVWNKYLAKKLIKDVGFTQSQVDECLFYKGRVIYALYTDDSIIAGPTQDEIEQVVNDIKRVGLNITVEGTLEDFLGVHIDRKEDGSIHLTQPHLIDRILQDLKMDNPDLKPKSTPAASSRILSYHSASETFDNSFHYRSIIGKLNFLEKSTRPDIAFITHQCARYSSDPRKEHGMAIRWLARYLKGTRDKGMILTPTQEKDLEVHVDADFAGAWDPTEAHRRDTARSRHGYVISYRGCPIIWKSQLQTEIALSSTESEYTGLSYALRDAIPVMQTLQEMKDRGFPIGATHSNIYCQVFEDNSGAVEMATHHKYRPRTKHLNVKLHHFRDYVNRGEIRVHHIGTDHQPADLLTKSLNEELTNRHRRTIMGW